MSVLISADQQKKNTMALFGFNLNWPQEKPDLLKHQQKTLNLKQTLEYIAHPKTYRS